MPGQVRRERHKDHGVCQRLFHPVGRHKRDIHGCVPFRHPAPANVLIRALTALIMKRILWSPGSQGTSNSTAPGQPARGLRSQRQRQPRKSVQWRVVESLVQSAAIYSLASVSLAVTSFLSPAIGFPACHSVFPSIIVRPSVLPVTLVGPRC